MKKDYSRWYLLVIVSLLAIIAAGFIREFKEGQEMAEEAIYFQVTTILNQAEAIAWDKASNPDAPIPMNWDWEVFKKIDFNILGVMWVDGPFPSGPSTIKAGRYVLHLERTPSSIIDTGYWERSE